MATAVINDRALGLTVGYAATSWNAPVTFDQYAQALSDWTIRAIQRNDETIGAVFSKDGEVHVSVLPQWRRQWATKGLLRELLSPPVKTRIAEGHDYMREILIRLGFAEQPDGMFVKEA